MEFSTPWRLSLNAHDLERCPLIENLVEEKHVPNPLDESQYEWSFVAVRDELRRVPEATEALMEVVTEVWRPREVWEVGVNDESWRRNVPAWLVRGRTLVCHNFIFTVAVADEGF